MPKWTRVVRRNAGGNDSATDVFSSGSTHKVQAEAESIHTVEPEAENIHTVEPEAESIHSVQPGPVVVGARSIMDELHEEIDEELEELWKGFETSLVELLDNLNDVDANAEEQTLTDEQYLIIKQREEICRLRRENQTLKELLAVPKKVPHVKPKLDLKPNKPPDTRKYVVLDLADGCGLNFTCKVYSEPHLNSKVRTKKGRGAFFLCSGMTMNGWLKLENDEGWVLPNMGGLEGLDEVARPCADNLPMRLAVDEYQPQGVCSFKVLTKSPVYASASRNAARVGIRRRGEYVFAQLQNFNGWIQLIGDGESGWMPASSEDCARKVLQLRRVGYTNTWALCDLWSAARIAMGGRIHADVACMLKDLEDLAHRSVMRQCADGDLIDKFFEDGLLDDRNAEESGVQLRQMLFTKMLLHRVHKDRQLSRLIPNFQLLTYAVPLPDDSMDVGDRVEIESCDSLMTEDPSDTEELTP